jgi:protein Mpv17
MQFTTCAFIVSPLGYLWLENLESWFPGMTEPKKPSEKPEKGARSEPKAEKPRLNVKNTVVKVLIDQTIGAAWNTILFISTMGMLQGLDYGTIENQIHQVRI